MGTDVNVGRVEGVEGVEDVDEGVDEGVAEAWRTLPGEAAELARLLGLHPGHTVTAGAAAALAGVEPGRVRWLLEVLTDAGLLDQAGPGAHELADPVRAYAAERARREVPEAARTAALRRVLTWYLHTADAARRAINPRAGRVPLADPPEGVRPLTFAGYAQAVQWYDDQRRNLMAAVRAADEGGFDRVAWQLPAVLRAMHARFHPFDEWLAMSEIGLRATRRCGDRVGEAELLDSLGLACLRTGVLDEAAGHAEACLALRREAEDRAGTARAVNLLGLVRLRRRDFDDVEEAFRQARELWRAEGSLLATSALENLANVAYDRGDLAVARERVTRAVDEYAAATDGGRRGNALRLLAAVLRETGEPEEALAVAREAVALAVGEYRQVAEGYWLLELGAAQRATGRLAEALVSYQRSAAIHRRLGDRAREARAWQGAGEVYRAMERFGEAVDFHRAAARVQRQVGDGWQLAVALDGLASAAVVSGDGGADEVARRAWREAMAALEAFGHGDARAGWLRERIRGELVA